MKKHVCDICGFEFEKGLKMKEIGIKGLIHSRDIYICEKCRNVVKLVVLSYRRMPEVR